MPTIDLTGGNLTSYLLNIIKDVVGRIPRFRSALGDTSIAITNNQISFGDLQVVIKDVTSSGNRLSPNYFISTQIGRSVVAKVENKEGAFIEWILETDNDGSKVVPGVYYFDVTSVDEATQQVQFTVERYLWDSGTIASATGSIIYFVDTINGEDVVLADADSPGRMVNYVSHQSYSVLTTPVANLSATLNGNPLTPITDFWVLQTTTSDFVTTQGGKQAVDIDVSDYVNYSLVDESGFTLRPGIDYIVMDGQVVFSPWTAPNIKISLVGAQKLNPTTNAINPENFLPVTLSGSQTLTASQTSIRAASGNYTTLTPVGNKLCLPTLLQPGEWANWDLRVSDGQYTTFGQKREFTNFVAYTQNAGTWTPTEVNGAPSYIIPGVAVGIGDKVKVGDQVAIIVSPFFTETYELYGSKDNLSFTLDVRANDYNTASEISESLRHALLVHNQDQMAADGVTILEAARSNRNEQRDQSGTALSFVFSLNVTAMCDWTVFVPLVTRIVDFDVTMTPAVSWGSINPAPRASVYGSVNFVNFIPDDL